MFKILKTIIYSCGLILGLLIYVVTKKSPYFGYQSMVHLFCLTKGRSNDLITSVIKLLNPPEPIDYNSNTGFLKSEVDKAAQSINEKGYYIFNKKLSEDMCNRLLQFALTERCEGREMDMQTASSNRHKTIYSRGQSDCVRYDFFTDDLLANKDIQILLGDLSFADVAQSYLGSKPTIDIVTMWWHTAYSKEPDKKAAQYYHFDMDRPKWLKFFVYLTDVTVETGPHVFIEGTHKSGEIPSKFLNKGYSRLTDNEINEVYDSSRIKEFIAPRGTIIAEDTRGLHKGKNLINSDRLILQFQYSNSQFGGKYAKSKILKIFDTQFKASLKNYPFLYTQYM
jgi:hypothetical protein